MYHLIQCSTYILRRERLLGIIEKSWLGKPFESVSTVTDKKEKERKTSYRKIMKTGIARGTEAGDLDKVGDVEGHFIDLSVVKLFNISQHANVFRGDKVDCDSFSSESAASTDAMDVVLPVSGKVVVDDK